ncbi:MAG: hemerythrin domain-containing protein [Alcanivorax sp.]|nr:hemerythrin domain-containing protein [Alcanivorax sp.]
MKTPLVTAVLQRQQLPDTIRNNLYGPPRSQWREHPYYLISDARALQRNHNGLKRQARQYHGALTYLMSLNEADRQSHHHQQLLGTVIHHGQALLKHLHSHHGFEDSSVFPVLRLHHPRLEKAISLLENDHLALDSLLQQIGNGLRDTQGLSRDARILAQAHHQAGQLETLLQRHMDDEEEIIVPVYLQQM